MSKPVPADKKSPGKRAMLGKWSGSILFDVPGCGEYTVFCEQCHGVCFHDGILIALSLLCIFLLAN